MNVYVLTAVSESGDAYGPWVFKAKPKSARLKAFLEEKAPWEFEETGPGWKGSNLFIDLVKVSLIE